MEQIHNVLKKYICSVMACLLLISGMWLSYFRADSLFSYPEFADVHAVITASDSISAEQVMCTDELLGYQRIETALCRMRTFSRSPLQLHESLSLPCQPQIFAMSSIQAICADYPCDSVPSRTVIISYIHHQDGAKG